MEKKKINILATIFLSILILLLGVNELKKWPINFNYLPEFEHILFFCWAIIVLTIIFSETFGYCYSPDKKERLKKIILRTFMIGCILFSAMTEFNLTVHVFHINHLSFYNHFIFDILGLIIGTFYLLKIYFN